MAQKRRISISCWEVQKQHVKYCALTHTFDLMSSSSLFDPSWSMMHGERLSKTEVTVLTYLNLPFPEKINKMKKYTFTGNIMCLWKEVPAIILDPVITAYHKGKRISIILLHSPRHSPQELVEESANTSTTVNFFHQPPNIRSKSCFHHKL